MDGKSLILAAIRGETVERVPWIPFVGCHGGHLLGIPADEYLKSSDHVIAGTCEAIRRYRPDGIPIVFDLQVEAEAMGCNLIWARENPPAVASHPLAERKTLADLHVPEAGEGRIPVFTDAARVIKRAHPEVALYGLVTGPFTLALHLQGTDIFMGMVSHKHELLELMRFCQQVTTRMADYYIDAGCDVIAVVDPMTSQIGPQHFVQFVSPFETEIFAHLRRRGAPGSFFVCGDAQHNVEAMCQCAPDNVSVDENIPLENVRDTCLKHGVSFGGNLQLTVVLLMGTEQDAMRNALACMSIGGTRGFILAPGCDLPYSTPPANLEAVAAVVHDPYQRDVARTLSGSSGECPVLDLDDYGKIGKVIVDVITLDSESCTPCQYMVEAVRSAAAAFEGIVEWREHKIKESGSVTFMKSLMVRNVPTICIDGRITFVSKIPPREELVAAIRERILEKLQYRLKRKKGEIYIFGASEAECAPLRANIRQALDELGADLDVVLRTGEEERRAFGVAVTPAVVLARYFLKAEGQIPPVPIIKEWIKEID